LRDEKRSIKIGAKKEKRKDERLKRTSRKAKGQKQGKPKDFVI